METKLNIYGFIPRALLLDFAVAVLLSLSHCSGKTTTQPGTNQVWMQNYAYNPASISVPVNTTVTWTNKDNMPHTVTSDSGVFNSDTIPPGSTYSRQFTTAGSYPYHCTIHTFMHGTVTVK